ncbi:MAG: TauD/TfdA family dioxygenase, partial [Gammaproteobacteria bacterium]|nr:TauD/TfdA family dioxygenase [Gammaproteobacteria bacterium]
CEVPPAEKGETLLCDGIALVKALKPDVREYLQTRALKYTLPIPYDQRGKWFEKTNPDKDELKKLSAMSYFTFTKEGNQYVRHYVTPVLHKPMFADELAFGNFLLFARHFGLNNFPTLEDDSLIPDEIYEPVKQIADSLTIAHKWQTNDILMVDNTRFMHGRNEVINPEERVIWTQFGYTDLNPLSEQEKARQPWRQDSAEGNRPWRM